MSTHPTAFNLIDEPWIQALDQDGASITLSLKDAFTRAHEIRDITCETPTVRFAVLRILLSITYRVLDDHDASDPLDHWADLWEAPTFDMEQFEDYFAQWHHRFDLLDPQQPFLQTADLRTEKDEWKPVSLIVADSDPDAALFTMRSELEHLSLAEATRWLIHAHAYDFSGIKSGAMGDPRVKGGKGYPMGIGWAGWLGGTVVVGKTLKETLLLNFVSDRPTASPNDLPIWEKPALTAAPRTPEDLEGTGPISLMTWPQRRIRLNEESGRIVGVLVCNGDPLDYTIQWNHELMSGWKFSEPQSAKAKELRYMPSKYPAGHALWRGLATLLPGEGATGSDIQRKALAKRGGQQLTISPAVVRWIAELVEHNALSPDEFITLSTVSMEYGTQMASYSDIVSDELSFSAALTTINAQGLRDLVESAADRATLSARALINLAVNLKRAAGASGHSIHDEFKDEVASELFSNFDIKFREWLLQVTPGCDVLGLLSAWTEQVREIVNNSAMSFVQAAPDTAWLGNHEGVTVAKAKASFDRELYRVLGAPPPNPVTQSHPEDATTEVDQ